ncbi:MAG: SDR family NAD-dependent epimerase/dehydratase [Rhodothermaeota bacterium MED-G64]|nr:MAG: SDR family NAD-dependent epimerase/dehydratase [Rhodothermaeota bacterium MED-G64]|tara:strand:+ start:1065 stop:2009 length:945 start_codon:yes stop_codon:yes gene_type:complete
MNRGTVVITGGAGFLGSHLCDYYISRDWKVIAIDNLITGDLDNLQHLFSEENFKFLNHDVTNYIHISEDVDLVLHFASPASPVDYLEIPIQTLKVGSIGTHKALGLAKAKKAIFVLASTSEVYGDPLVHPQPETYWGNVNPIGYRGVYDETKRFAEAMTMAYHRFHHLPTKIARIFNTYGPRMRSNDGRALPTFIHQALLNEDLTVFGTGEQTRSFCYIDDMVEGIYLLSLSSVVEPINLGNPDEITITDFAKEIINLIGSSSNIVYRDLPIDDPKIRKPDIKKAQEILGWSPKISRHDGLLSTIKYVSERLNS